ncbi:hypothetical protein MHYP_G00097180 [Metynnis hypsauchen]
MAAAQRQARSQCPCGLDNGWIPVTFTNKDNRRQALLQHGYPPTPPISRFSVFQKELDFSWASSYSPHVWQSVMSMGDVRHGNLLDGIGTLPQYFNIG